MNSILDFWYQMTANPLLFIAVTLTLGVILVNGWTDAPNAIATCVVTRCMPPKAAILMAALFNFLGVFIMTKINKEVAVTITNMVNFGENSGRIVIIVLCAAMLAIVIWATLAWVFGIPTSESHALIAGLTGGAMALCGLEAIVWSQWLKVIYGIAISVGLGFGLAWVICKLVTKLFYHADCPKTEPFFKGVQIVGAASMAFMHGAQDGQKFMGIILLCEIMGAFENFKKSKKIRELIIALNDVEEECDQLYLTSMRELTQKSTDILAVISWREIYECFEACADACEYASECVASVIMKNT